MNWCHNSPDLTSLVSNYLGAEESGSHASHCLCSYVGHGAGARFLDGQRILKKEMRAASLLFGCSSAALAVRGELEGTGIILNYLMAGW